MLIAWGGLVLAGVAPAASRADDSAGNSAFYCQYYADGDLDVMSNPAAYLFIGERPLCTEAARKKTFCKVLVTRSGYLTTKNGEQDPAETERIARDQPDEVSRTNYRRQHPTQMLPKAMVACGYDLAQIRAKLVAEAVAAIPVKKADGSDDIDFVRSEAPATLREIWTRECAGHLKVSLSGEDEGIQFSGNPAYDTFCTSTTTTDRSRRQPIFEGDSSTHTHAVAAGGTAAVTSGNETPSPDDEAPENAKKGQLLKKGKNLLEGILGRH